MDATGAIIQITAGPLEAGALMEAVRTDACGAIACFVGVVREEHLGRKVHHLIYEAYPPMAEQEMRLIAAEVAKRWQVGGVALAHRTGRLEIGETSVVVAVAAPHRSEALQACAFAIERIKQSVPIWKKEFGDEGEAWVIGDPSRGPARS